LGDRDPNQGFRKQEKKEAMRIFKEIWSEPNSSLHRMYSSLEELERNVDVKSETEIVCQKHKFHPCPYCGAKQSIVKPLNGIFPYQKCESCKLLFYIQKDLTVRKISKEEIAEIPGAWIQIVEDFARKKVSVVFRME
jgi:hypothetical protein